MASGHGSATGEIPHEIYGRALVGNFEPCHRLFELQPSVNVKIVIVW
jgi:hypothetical protein